MKRKWRVEFLRGKFVVATYIATTSTYYPEVAKDDVAKRMQAFILALGLPHTFQISPFGRHPDYDKPLKLSEPKAKLPRKERAVKFWTPEKVDQLITLWKLDFHTSMIAERLGTTKGAVCGRVHRLVQKGVLQARDQKAFSSRWSVQENKRRRAMAKAA